MEANVLYGVGDVGVGERQVLEGQQDERQDPKCCW
jgi:hypothetical protein